MKAIVGLGNIGIDYELTRHNIGFMVIDNLAEENYIETNRNKGTFQYGLGKIDETDAILAKPSKFMNRSGSAILEIMREFEIPIKDIIIIHDDIDLELGVIRQKDNGGDGGHRGIRSIIECTETKEFNRIRVGVGRPPKPKYAADYVLSPFRKAEIKAVEETITTAIQIVRDFISVK